MAAAALGWVVGLADGRQLWGGEQTQGALQETEQTLHKTKDSLKQTETRLEDTSAVLTEHKAVGEGLFEHGSNLLQKVLLQWSASA